MLSGRRASTSTESLDGPHSSASLTDDRARTRPSPMHVRRVQVSDLALLRVAFGPSQRGCAMAGSVRQRGRGAWELRVYLGIDPDSGRQRYATRTVRGSRRAATAALGELVEEAGYARRR